MIGEGEILPVHVLKMFKITVMIMHIGYHVHKVDKM